MANVKVSDLVTVTPTTNDLVLLSQSGTTRNASVSDIRGVVNDLTSGGVDKSLSAEQGKNINNKIGDLTSLTTTDKTNVVNAIKENTTKLSTLANKNYCINGNFDIWQRGTSFNAPPHASFTTDRFMVANVITGSIPTLVHSQRQLINGELDGSNFCYRIASDSLGVLNSNDYYQLSTHIENGTRKLCGASKKVTVSFYAKSSIANKKLLCHLFQKYGTGGSPSTSEYIAGKPVVLNTSWQKFTFTFNTNTLVGKTFGTNNDDVLKVVFDIAYGLGTAPTIGDTVGENFGNGYIEIAQVKIESGDMATPFVPNLPSEEIGMCRRYYQAIPFGGLATRTSGIDIQCNLPVEMRVTPTGTVYQDNSLSNVGKMWDDTGLISTSISGYTIGWVNKNLAFINATVTALHYYTGFITLDAEIY